MTFNILRLTGEQIRAARALSRLEQTELARRASLSLETIKRLERIRGAVEANARTLRAIQTAFEAIGIQFQGSPDGTVGVIQRSTSTGLENERTAHLPPERMRRLIYHGRLKNPSGINLRPTLAALHNFGTYLHRDLGLTGLTLILDGTILQALEGDQDRIETALKHLSSDPYHEQMQLLDDRATGHRVFSDMGFCCGLFPSDLMPSEGDLKVTSPFQPERLSPSEAIGLLMAARKRQQSMPRNGCLTPSSCALSALCMDPSCSDASAQKLAPVTP